MPRVEVLLPIAVALGAVVLAASELMTAFAFTPPGGEALREVSSADRHGYAMLVLALFALLALGFALLTGSKPAAYAVAGAGVVAMLLFLIVDLPDAGKLGDLEDPAGGVASARAEPQAGFWMEALGALTLGLGGIAFASLSPTQMQTLPNRLRRRRKADPAERPDPDPAGS